MRKKGTSREKNKLQHADTWASDEGKHFKASFISHRILR